MKSKNLHDEIQKADETFRKDVIIICGRFLGFVILGALILRLLVTPLASSAIAVMILSAVISFLFPFLFKKNFRVGTCSTILLSLMTILPLVPGLYNGGFRAPALALLTIVPLTGLLTNGKRGAWIGSFFAIPSIVAIFVLQLLGLISPMEGLQLERLHFYAPVILLGVMVAALVVGVLYENYKKRSDLNIIELSLKAQQASKMAALGEMASGLAHEINNPLTIIALNTEVLSSKLEQQELPEEELVRRINTIQETTFRASNIIKNLILFSSENRNYVFEKVSFRKVIQDVFEICDARFKHLGFQIYLETDEDFELDCNPHLISLVMVNILSNSFDAISDLQEKWVRLHYQKLSDNSLNISITDSGPGIPPEIVEKLMEPFFTTKEAGKGTGLGLSISRGIIESHRGKIWVDEKGPNTRFIINLPTVQPSSSLKRQTHG